MATIHGTVCHIFSDGSLLLLRKSTGLFGGGKWNGPGGKLRVGEDQKECAIREVLEETGLTVQEIKQHGILEFYFGSKKEPDWIVYVFSTHSFRGIAKSSSEGEVRWFRANEIPYDEMWEDDRYWLPLVTQGKNFRWIFYYDEEGNHLIEHTLTEE